MCQLTTLICALVGASLGLAMADDASPMEKHNQVDLVSVDNAGAVTLSMIETRAWGEKGALLPDLQAKIQTYLHYVESGQLVTNYPQVKDKPICFRLHTTFPPTQRENDFIALIKKLYLDPQHIEWKTSVFAKQRLTNR